MSSSKSSRIHLYSSDSLEEKGLFLEALDAKSSIVAPNPFEWSAPSFNLVGQTVSANNITDLGGHIKAMETTQASDHATDAAGIAANVNAIAALTTSTTADHSAQAALLGAETARATTAETQLQTNLDAEASTARAAESANAAAVVAEASARATAVTAEATRALAAEAGLQSSIDALGVTDTSTLASINQMLVDYEAADNSIITQISSIDGRVSTLEGQVSTLLA